jgi:hypothetical protein
VVLNVKRPEGAAAKLLMEELRGWVGEQLSPIAKPDEIRFTDNLPKTRSGKIMRRLLRAVARDEQITQDMSTLENPAILEQLRGGAPAAKTAAPKKASKKAPKKAAAATKKPATAAKKAPKRAAKAAATRRRSTPEKSRKPARRAPARKK